MVGYIGKCRERESRSASGNIPPRTTTIFIDKYRLQTCFTEVSESSRTGHSASGNDSAYFLGHFGSGVRWYDNRLSTIYIDYIAEFDLIGHRAARCKFTYDFYSISAKCCFCSREASLTAAGTHSQTGNMLKLIGSDRLSVAYSIKYLLKGNILTMAYICL